jgi:pyridoxamine 5'-phosphate oxidase
MRQELSGDDPHELWAAWFQAASDAEPNDPNAAALATATPDGIPSVRMVLIKQADQDGFVFFTNEESQKGRELHANPRAALCFHWKTLRRQVRVVGDVRPLDEKRTSEYFHSRSRASQIAAAVSSQSRPLPDRQELDERFERYSREIDGQTVPCPGGWNGYCIVPSTMEFWKDGANRLHDRRLFTRTDPAAPWTSTLLYP